ncbi:exodeoxyribonuclease VII large subunit [Roseisalinus antarcticus]|uniref:Exodeoxyribonuclease 7 large subunit n=1 Tax=Roseisalinus antarcticus TaxID=254357 RepID=A0A1Y5TP09_9RHOB|nr:exodeoxyribonuclease VII large subunit [Roseisalinus antarcticus]SLN66409.1 Exodeoxyribonuclease 7 large subunit [Roseisalinus antarcticus]
MDLIDDPTPGRNTAEYTVSEIAGAVKRTLEDEFGRIRVRGEVGRVFKARSGHLYYDVKDDRNVLACTTWKGQVGALSVMPEEGLEVIVTGRLSAFGAQSKYNLNVDEVAVAGVGALMAMFEKRKKLLEAEGLFAPERKKVLPYLPDVIGVVTSPSGAVIRDILHRLADRFPRKVLVWPVAVQGQSCAAEVARAIEGFNRMAPGGALPRPDLLIVARGGGSIEDLWGFNEEIVARAAAASEIPLISAVGHETDTTLIDHVADRRAPTPTAAAEMAVPVRSELKAWLDGQGARLSRHVSQALTQRGQRLRDLARGLGRPEALLETARQRLDTQDSRLPRALGTVVSTRRHQLAEAAGGLRPAALRTALADRRRVLGRETARLAPALDRILKARREALELRAGRIGLAPLERDLARDDRRLTELAARFGRVVHQQQTGRRDRLGTTMRLLDSLSYKGTLARGYAVVRGDGAVVTRAVEAKKAAVLEIEFVDGTVTRSISRAKAKRSAPPPDQGTLF